MAMNQDEVFEKIREALVDALGVDDDEVTPDARIQSDLGAESIDFLDIQFRLEKAFDIKIPRGEMLPDNVLNDPQYVAEGKLTDAGLALVREKMPHADIAEIEADPRIETLFDPKVQMLVNYIESKVNG